MIGNNGGNPAFVVLDTAGGPPRVFSAGDWISQLVAWKSPTRLLGGVRNTQQNWSTKQSLEASVFVSIE